MLRAIFLFAGFLPLLGCNPALEPEEDKPNLVPATVVSQGFSIIAAAGGLNLASFDVDVDVNASPQEPQKAKVQELRKMFYSEAEDPCIVDSRTTYSTSYSNRRELFIRGGKCPLSSSLIRTTYDDGVMSISYLYQTDNPRTIEILGSRSGELQGQVQLNPLPGQSTRYTLTGSVDTWPYGLVRISIVILRKSESAGVETIWTTDEEISFNFPKDSIADISIKRVTKIDSSTRKKTLEHRFNGKIISESDFDIATQGILKF